MIQPENPEMEAVTQNVPKDIPPTTFARNIYGLVKGIDYVFNEDGTIDWRKMIKPEYVVVNEQYFKKFGKTVPKSTEGLQDKELIILLGGLKELAQLRGYTEVSHVVTSPNENYVVSVCSIKFIPNYETGDNGVTYSAIGDASPLNTSSFGRIYLGAFAENRALARCIRNFLKINIVSDIELGNNTHSTPDASDTSSNLLMEVMQTNNISFEKIKETLSKDGFEGADKINHISDIPKAKQFELIERIKKAVKK